MLAPPTSYSHLLGAPPTPRGAGALSPHQHSVGPVPGGPEEALLQMEHPGLQTREAEPPTLQRLCSPRAWCKIKLPPRRAGLTPHLSSPVSVVGSVGSHLDGLEYLDYLHLLGRGALSKVSEVVGNSCKWRGLGLSQGHWACLLVYCPFPSWRQQLGLFMVVSPAP